MVGENDPLKGVAEPKVDFDSIQVVGQTKWLTLETMKYMAQDGNIRAWDRAVRTTKQDEKSLDAVAIIATLRHSLDEDVDNIQFLNETEMMEEIVQPKGRRTEPATVCSIVSAMVNGCLDGLSTTVCHNICGCEVVKNSRLAKLQEYKATYNQMANILRKNKEEGDMPDMFTGLAAAKNKWGIPKINEDEVVLVKQFRPALDSYTIEAPAGLIDEGETAEQAALRELKEECGYVGTVRYTHDPKEHKRVLKQIKHLEKENKRAQQAADEMRDTNKRLQSAMSKTKYMSAHLSMELEKMNINPLGNDENGDPIHTLNAEDALKAFKGKELEAELREF